VKYKPAVPLIGKFSAPNQTCVLPTAMERGGIATPVKVPSRWEVKITDERAGWFCYFTLYHRGFRAP